MDVETSNVSALLNLGKNIWVKYHAFYKTKEIGCQKKSNL